MIEQFKYDPLQVLHDISGLIRSKESLEGKFVRSVRLIRDAFQCHSISLFLYDAGEQRLTEVASEGGRVDLITETPFEMGSGLSAWVAQQRHSVVLPDIRRDHPAGFRSFSSTPLLSGDDLIGVLNMGHRKQGFFNESHREVMEIIAGQLAVAIDRARFERELIEKNAALEEASLQIETQYRKLVEMEHYQMFAQVAGSINHEINNPLTSIIGNAELLLIQGDSLDEGIKKKIQVIFDEGKRIGVIVEKLRDTKQLTLKNYIGLTGDKIIDLGGNDRQNGEKTS